ncbi:MAG: hypothetical protein Q8R05_03260 [Candidatus Omnitrophota bacterium]|nr:hypothetical protein [Candidatus Omnitrophota bacterium]
MAYGLKVIDTNEGITFDCKRENMAGKKEFVEPVGYAPNGKVVERKQFDISTGKPVQYTFKYVDEDGNQYEKSEITWKIGDEVVSPIEMTSVFEIKSYRPIIEYSDRFVIEKYYELAPDQGPSSKGKKKISDSERERIRVSNLMGMRKLWEKLMKEGSVAGGNFNASSGNFKPGMAFLRAIKVNGNKWGLELGVFKEEKIFEHLQEGTPHAVAVPVQQGAAKKLEANFFSFLKRNTMDIHEIDSNFIGFRMEA